MSTDIEVPFSSPPLKRPSLFLDDASKCGEIFVTSNAEKWTFLCGYCQEFTDDIGTFICHIRLEHLNSHIDSQIQQNQQDPEAESNVSTTIATSRQADTNLIGFMPTIQIADALSTEELQPQSEIVKEDTVTSTREVFETICFKVSKIVDITSSNKPQSNDTDNFNANKEAITNLEYGSDDAENDDSNSQCTYTVNDAEGDDVSKQDDSNVQFIDESCDDNIANGSGIAKTPETLLTETTAKVDEKVLHDKKDERSLKYKCKLCDKVYKTRWGLSLHKDTHKRHKIYQCPLCPKTEKKEVNFVSHVLRHESESCFPCQVCGKLFDTNAERVKHWETHISDRPYACDICFRRYRKIGVLDFHMKSHGLR